MSFPPMYRGLLLSLLWATVFGADRLLLASLHAGKSQVDVFIKSGVQNVPL